MQEKKEEGEMMILNETGVFGNIPFVQDPSQKPLNESEKKQQGK